MIRSAVDDVYDWLLANNHAGGETLWDLVRRKDTDELKNQRVIVSEDGGPPEELSAAAGIGDSALADVGVLLTVVGEEWDSDATRAKALEIHTALVDPALRGKALSGTDGAVYYRVEAMTGEPIFAGFDDRGRPRHTMAFRLLRDVRG